MKLLKPYIDSLRAGFANLWRSWPIHFLFHHREVEDSMDGATYLTCEVIGCEH